MAKGTIKRTHTEGADATGLAKFHMSYESKREGNCELREKERDDFTDRDQIERFTCKIPCH